MERNRRSSGNGSLWKVLLVLFLAAAIIGLAFTVVQAHRQHQAQERLDQLAESVRAREEEQAPPAEASDAVKEDPPRETPAVQGTEEDPLGVLEEMGIPIPEKEIDFVQLQEEVNPDIYAWIYIPDTQIDYPVLQHPTDNLYYLEYNLDGSRGYPGCIYTEDYNEKDFSDPNTVIYGHNMKNGTMFAGLHKFEDSKYFEEHPYVYIYTEEKLFVYEIFAAYESGNEHILYNNDFTSEYEYSKYLENLFSMRTMNCNRKENVTVTTENRIVTLSTCVANKSDRRYLVQGVLLNEG